MSNYLGFLPTKEKEFYFISYNSEDNGIISPIVTSLSKAGIPLWYDYGIDYGEKWAIIINEKISEAQAVLLFFTKGILHKENSYVQKEWKIATELKKKIYVLFVDEMESDQVPVSKMDWWVDIKDKQCLNLFRMKTQKEKIQEVMRALETDETEQDSTPAHPKRKASRHLLKNKKAIPVILCVFLLAAGLLTFLLTQNQNRDSNLNLPSSEWEYMKMNAFGANFNRYTYPMTKDFDKCWSINPLEDSVLHITVSQSEGEQFNDLKIMLVDDKQNILESAVIPKERKMSPIHWNIHKGYQYLVYQFLGDPVYEQELKIELVFDGEEGFNPGG